MARLPNPAAAVPGPAPGPAGTTSLIRRLIDRARAFAERLATTAWTPVVIARDVYKRDQEVGGAVLAGAIAFRVFVWLLAFTLILVAGLGFLSAAGSNPADATATVGVTAFAASSISHAGQDVQRSRWVLLVLGLWALWGASKNSIRAVWVTSALVWRQPVSRAPAVKGFAVFNLTFVAMILTMAGAAKLRDVTPGPGLLITIASVVVFVVLMAVGLRGLPKPKVPWTAMVPGAVLLAVGIQVMHMVAVLYLPHRVGNSSKTFGELGIAVAMLLWIYLFGRLLVLAGVINATLWDRRTVTEGLPSDEREGSASRHDRSG